MNQILIKILQKIVDKMFPSDRYIVIVPWGACMGYLSIDVKVAAVLAKETGKTLICIPTPNTVNKELYFCHFDCNQDQSSWKYKLIYFILVDLVLFYNRVIYPLRKLNVTQGLNLDEKIGYQQGNFYKCISGLSLKFDIRFYKPLAVHINKSQLKRGQKLLQFLGINENEWWVCLHVRESGYYKDQGRTYRDASISNYISVIRYITERGGYVIRMGDPSMTALPKMERVIDYIKTPYYSDIGDLFLIHQCRAFIGGDSGLAELALLLGKAVCRINNFDLFTTMGNICCYKHIFCKKRKKIIPFKEILMSFKKDWVTYGWKYIENFIVIENTPLEIRNTVMEFMEDLDCQKLSPLQQEALDLIRLTNKPLIGQDSSNYGNDALASGAKCDHLAKISSFYLENCWEDSPYLDELSKLYSGK